MNIKEKAKNSLLGLACGDAQGSVLEFTIPGTLEPITDMIGGGSFELPKGYWTDDTSINQSSLPHFFQP